MIIKKAKKEDFEDYRKLRKECDKEYSKIIKQKFSLSEKIIQKIFDDIISSRKKKFCYFVIEKDNPVGYITGSIHNNNGEDYGYVDDLFISKEYRKKGFASKLIKTFIYSLKENRVKKLTLGVHVKNKKAYSLYKKLGFIPTHFEMEKKLKE